MSPDWLQMAIIENTFLAIFDPRSTIGKDVFDCHLSSVILLTKDNGICDNPRCQILPGAKGLTLIVMKYWFNGFNWIHDFV